MLETSNSGDSFFSTISRRLDAAVPYIGKVLLVCSIIWAVFALSAIIIPAAYERSDLVRRLDQRKQEVEDLKQQLSDKYEYVDMLDDPYFLYLYAISEYKFVPRDGTAKA
ncbi:MAG: hypothetical protein L6Q71_01170 [Planctomycetes bacterium]|nr:hypothetical protein [Planctomycetota bacterium]NUQ33664.1 hypothetical protein [Planctomycetaceae bacterium]